MDIRLQNEDSGEQQSQQLSIQRLHLCVNGLLYEMLRYLANIIFQMVKVLHLK